MILFTGNSAISRAFLEMFPCKIISARKLNNVELAFWIMKTDVIIHNAAVLNANNYKDYIEGNFILTKRIIDLVNDIKPSIKFLNISSMSILSGDNEYLHFEKMTDYGFSKFIAEQYCLNSPLRNKTNIRFSTIFYADEKRDGISKLIFDCVNRNEIILYNDGSSTRDILPMKTLCQYLYRLSKMKVLNQTVNIVSGKVYSFREIAHYLKAKNNKLIINNLSENVKYILSDFSKNDIEYLGFIDVDIENELSIYYDRLNEDINI